MNDDELTNEIIEKIRAVQDELEALKVKRENIPFAKLSEESLRDELEAVTEQLKNRKKFMEKITDEKDFEVKPKIFAR